MIIFVNRISFNKNWLAWCNCWGLPVPPTHFPSPHSHLRFCIHRVDCVQTDLHNKNNWNIVICAITFFLHEDGIAFCSVLFLQSEFHGSCLQAPAKVDFFCMVLAHLGVCWQCSIHIDTLTSTFTLISTLLGWNSNLCQCRCWNAITQLSCKVSDAYSDRTEIALLFVCIHSVV